MIGWGPPKPRSRLARLDPPPLRGAAAVVGDGGDIPDTGDDQTGRLQGPDGSLAAATGASHEDVNLSQAVLHPPPYCVLGRHLSCVGRALSRALEAAGASSR